MRSSGHQPAKPDGSTLAGKVRRILRYGERVYAVVDAARDRPLAFAASKEFGQTIRWLFKEGSGAHMLEVAPYLVPISMDPRASSGSSGYLDLWAQKLGTSAGVLLIAAADDHTVCEHLRNVFHATDDTGHAYYFRFYDPRVLRPYLPTCTASEARQFFGPIRRILVESETRDVLLNCQANAAGVTMEEVPLSQAVGTRPNRYR